MEPALSTTDEPEFRRRKSWTIWLGHGHARVGAGLSGIGRFVVYVVQ
jgi:hypothetical protein